MAGSISARMLFGGGETNLDPIWVHKKNRQYKMTKLLLPFRSEIPKLNLNRLKVRNSLFLVSWSTGNTTIQSSHSHYYFSGHATRMIQRTKLLAHRRDALREGLAEVRVRIIRGFAALSVRLVLVGPVHKGKVKTRLKAGGMCWHSCGSY
jgi:hypothetical protein